jgi:hypothetical protein
MKGLLGCLMCLVFTASQTFAISGGPFGTPKLSPQGTYAGVMTFKARVPVCDTPPCPGQPTGTNQLGLFTLVVPQTGLATGTAVFFNQGQIYSGTIQATADPQTAQVKGIISATFSYIIVLPDGSTTTTVDAQAAGKTTINVRASTTTFTANSVLLGGQADIQFALTVNNPFDEIKFHISGFKQA